MYNYDSFFTLSQTGQTGLALLSFILSLSLILLNYGCQLKLRIVNSIIKSLLFSLSLFWLFVWLSPQIYYQYYQMIFNGLPTQIVIKSPPGLFGIFNLLTFRSGINLSDHSKAVLGWGLVITPWILFRSGVWRNRVS